MERPDETALFVKHAQGMIGELNLLFQQGIERLSFGMHQWKNVDKMPSFDRTTKPAPYSHREKNYYIDASNNMWMNNLWLKMQIHPSFSELYYSALLNAIETFKKNNDGFSFNKGIVYANLGVAQAGQMKLDEGFANILKALCEDSSYSANIPEDNLFKSRLFTQFEDRYVKQHIQRIVSQLNVNEISSVEQFVAGFLDSLNSEQRSFFDYTFAKTILSWKIWTEMENGFTASRLLAYTQDLCLFSEDFLRSKFSQSELSSLPRKELGYLIPPKIGVSSSGCSVREMSDLDLMLPLEMQKQNPKERCFRILLILRNYSSHNIGGGTNVNYFYAHYDAILNELIRALCFIALLPKPP